MNEDRLSDTDELALNRLMHELMWRLNSDQSDAATLLYTEDLVMEEGPPLNQRLVGRDAMVHWGKHRPEFLRVVLTNLRWVADGPDHARGNAVMLSFVDDHALGSTVPNMVGDQSYRCRRTDEGWRIEFVRNEFCFLRPRDVAPESPAAG